MARGESQTLLIWTIIFLILLLIMIIVTVVLRGKYTEAASQFADATSQNKQLTSENSTLKQDVAKLQELIGFPTDMPVAEIATKTADNIKLYAPTLPDATSYVSTLKNLADSYTNQVSENEKLNKANSQLQDELKEFNAAKAKLQEEYNSRVDGIRKEQEAERAQHSQQLADLKVTNQKLVDDADKMREDSLIAIRKANELRDTATAQRDLVTKINVDLTTMVAEMDSPIPTYANAEILWVSADSTEVRVNLGSNHGLRPRMPFSVYSADVKEISKELPPGTEKNNTGIPKVIDSHTSKGKIEVTKIIDGNTAEARVTEDILMNPILKGDIIYTPIWRPGQHVHVALSSGLDLDGDGVPDPHKVIALIKQCGGEVDAYIDDLTGEMKNENGKMVRQTYLVGKITEETRYLVSGQSPDPESSATLFNARRDMENDAKLHGVTGISLNDLLALMGQRQQSQTVGFGPRNRAINDYEMQPDVLNRQMPGYVFKKYEDPDAKPDTNNKTPVSPLFNQRPITRPTGTVSPLFQPRTAPTKDIDSL